MKSVFPWIFFLYCSETILSTDAQCTMPFEDEDTYVSASIGTFKVNATHFVDYPVTIPTVTSPFDFRCFLKRGDQYVLKSVQEPNLFHSLTFFYMCIELHKVDNYTYIYFLGTEYDPLARDNLIGDSSGGGGTFDNVCNRDYPYESHTFVMLVNADAYDNGFLNTRCPDDLLAVFLRFNVTSSTGSTSDCPGSTLDVCSNRTTMSFSYNSSCSAPAKTTSINGSYSCLYTTTADDTTYLGVWNQDSTVDEENNFRYSCFAYRKEGDTVYASETPKYCAIDSSPTKVPAGKGVSLVIWDIAVTCPDVEPVSPDEPVNIAWLYYMIAGLAVLPILIWLICLFTWCYKKYGCICKKIKLPKFKMPKIEMKKTRLTPSPEPEIDVSRGETVEPVARFSGPIIKAPDFNMASLFRPKKPVDDFTMLSAVFLEHKLVSLETPNIGPMYKDTLDDYLNGGIRRSYTQISIDSAILEKNDKK